MIFYLFSSFCIKCWIDVLLKKNNCKQQKIKCSFAILSNNDISNLNTHRQEECCFTNASRVQVPPEAMSAEQRRFRSLAFFRADSEDIENISANQRFFGADQLWFFSEFGLFRTEKFSAHERFEKNSALNQRCSGLITYSCEKLEF